jgi:hypothetical protein
MEDSMETAELALRYGIALLIGILIGVEREYARLKEEVKSFAGVRTFPLIALQPTRNPAGNPQKPASKPAISLKYRTYVLLSPTGVPSWGNRRRSAPSAGSSLLHHR